MAVQQNRKTRSKRGMRRAHDALRINRTDRESHKTRAPAIAAALEVKHAVRCFDASKQQRLSYRSVLLWHTTQSLAALRRAAPLALPWATFALTDAST